MNRISENERRNYSVNYIGILGEKNYDLPISTSDALPLSYRGILAG